MVAFYSVSNRLVLPSGCLFIVKCKVHLTLCTCASKLGPRDGYLYSLGTFICMGTTIQKLDSPGLTGTYFDRVLVIDGYLYSRVYGM